MLVSHPLKPFTPFYHSYPLRKIPQKPCNFPNRKSPVSTFCISLGDSPIHRIAEKLRELGFAENPSPAPSKPSPEPNSPGEVFVPLPTHLPKYRVGYTLDPSWSTPENPLLGTGRGRGAVLLEDEEDGERGQDGVRMLAELVVERGELRKLRRLGIGMREMIKIGKAGITEGIVNRIHERWRTSEVVKLVCEDICKMNMRRTHEMLERKTGGLVIWRAGYKIVLYRGAEYKYPYFFINTSSSNDAAQGALSDVQTSNKDHGEMESCLSDKDVESAAIQNPIGQLTKATLIKGVGSSNKVRFQLPGEKELAEEADRLLDGLGPRFTDWWGYEPLPVDGDLLPEVVQGFRRPFRLLPYGISPKVTDDEMSILRRLGRPLPYHFALGRNKMLQGLACAIIKLWETCEIAKIAVKRGVKNTDSETMVEELKQLTGGTLLSRDGEFIVFYRGKDFLPAAVSSAIEERRKQLFNIDDQNEIFCQSNQAAKVYDGLENLNCASEIKADGTSDENGIHSCEERSLRLVKKAIERTDIKLSKVLVKKAKAEKLLSEVEKTEISQQPEADKEGITEEEKYMLRKIGLKMKPFLLMGRRGVFDGTVENMHLHWKYRELVKIICKEKSTEAVHQVALTLEAESGGILIAVERVRKGYAIIIYRGKKYKRPPSLRPGTLLTKRQAMKRSLEAQRRESLKLHVLNLDRHVDNLEHQLGKYSELKVVEMADDSETRSVKENVYYSQTDDDVIVDSELTSTHGSDHLTSVVTEEDQEHDKVRMNNGDELIFPDPTQAMEDSFNNLEDHHLANIINYSTASSETKDGKSEKDSSSNLVINENSAVVLGSSCQAGTIDFTSCPDMFMAEQTVSTTNDTKHVEATEPLVRLVNTRLDNESYEMHDRPVHLSNRDRLLLRKQALKMKKRPVLAVGKNNDVTGVAKAIKAHFKKHPLAIVNVKGRAKETSVQEVVFNLERATGAVLVSQEPSKVILYRGWGAGDESGFHNKSASYEGNTLKSMESKAWPAVSPDLLAAIRVECGLNRKKDECETQ